MPTPLLRGALPPYVVKSLSRSLIGIYSGVVERHFQVGAENQRINLDWLDPEEAPDPWDLPVTTINAEIRPPVCIVTYNYAGIQSDFTFSENQVTFELDTTMADDPIETHPAFQTLKAKYGWDPVLRQFQQFIPQPASATSGLSGGGSSSSGSGQPSPVFGVESWLVVGAVYRKTYASPVIPAGLFSNIGTIVSQPPDIAQFNLPKQSQSRNWLKLAPKVTRKGSAAEITEEWMLSGPKGWISDIYSLAQLGNNTNS